MPLYGRLEPFEGEGSAWAVYEEQVGVFFRANDTPEAKRRDIFLASCGTRVFALLRHLFKLATPHDKSLGELLATLRSNFSPALSTLMERFRFNNRSRQNGETLGQIVAALRGLASGCAFGEQLDSLFWDRCVCGINDPAMQTRLLELPDPSLDDAVKAALAMDAAAKDAGEIAHAARSPSAEAAVNKMVTQHGRCGGDHPPPPSLCQLAEVECFACGRTGHIARAFRGGTTANGWKQQPASSTCSMPAHGQGSLRKGRRRGRAAAASGAAARLHVVAEDPQIFDMWHAGTVQPSVPPYLLTVEVCGHPISMELNTGASVSFMAGKAFKRTFPGVSVEASCCAASYSGQLAQVNGQAQVSVRLGDREATLPLLPLYLTKGSSPTLLEWAAPIVPLLKQDASVKICGDFKVTINPVAAVEKYPLSRIEDLWSALSGGQKFTNLDLRDAYQ
ncbi:uncharacterized protein LOC144146455 [Haemaphysalis longicornis]